MELPHPSALFSGSHLDVPFVVLSLAYVATCFIHLGLCASDYLCPTVATLTRARSSARSRGILAAVLLAWCNSSPDLVTNFMSWTSSHTPALSVGEVLGSSGFILCVVQGALFVVMGPVRPRLDANHARHIFQDLSFVLVAVLTMLYVSLRNEITLLNCALMLALYAGYIASKTSATTESPGEEPSLELSETNDYDPAPKFSVLSALDYTALYAVMQQSSPLGDDAITMQTLDSRGLDAQFVAPRPLTVPTTQNFNNSLNNDRPVVHSSPSAFAPYHDDNEDLPDAINDVELPIAYEHTLHSRLLRLKNGALFVLAPQLLNFTTKSVPARLLAITMVPSTIILRLTCPQFQDLLQRSEDPGDKAVLEPKNLILMLTHSVCAPGCALMLLAILLNSHIAWPYILVSVVAATSLLTSTIAFRWQILQVNRFSLNDTEIHDDRAAMRLDVLERYVMTLFNAVGIINCVLWIAVFANALIEVMIIYQRLTNISEAVLGLTIFSWGNSVSDLVSNVAMCKLHLKIDSPPNQDERAQLASRYFFIALSACLGGILLNILIGVGLSGFTSMLINANGVNSNKFWLFRSVSLKTTSIDYKFVISAVFILVQDVLLLVVFSGIPVVTDFVTQYSKYVGIFLCFWWGLATLTNVIIETAA
ncbi:LAME_0F03642g1_1 [Lachancea meyersii CBS 8951]|uniref:LAME_0F03642g1_1 n=1 Tax=Lachancea meyersii CBS 8951 TaxID=1266667 RepID=A0A1G4JRD6_9SACH|nr:LAME_0F03642g1_1 [Lachancea meyersii CBS 8951]